MSLQTVWTQIRPDRKHGEFLSRQRVKVSKLITVLDCTPINGYSAAYQGLHCLIELKASYFSSPVICVMYCINIYHVTSGLGVI